MPEKKKSTKTTIAGWATFLGLAIAALGFTLDGDSETVSDWDGVYAAAQGLGLLTGGLGAAIGGFFARDDNVSSEGREAAKGK